MVVVFEKGVEFEENCVYSGESFYGALMRGPALVVPVFMAVSTSAVVGRSVGDSKVSWSWDLSHAEIRSRSAMVFTSCLWMRHFVGLLFVECVTASR
jgi:hypothetical protein